ncbi:uncharacterized protein NEPG_00801 [Nematocida parisii ERTm1]|uniref:uncharacterized protein n=1 Tax=Nematocida parisii (strain ERTm1 / ATCC PRA-289) TaxID=881290 RepID=UPI000264BAFF|nr:uncharacterized protein NEPG_00801 [Nematocida parisii ERTm1]EIJ94134.1 hypothetical protein NEPG_00801 [Nematocida parisii ERTm1]KAI5156290.1 hypothetical protein NEPAR05_0451 [Nematocida parisii]|eukprot:XP_013058630.1 hypothetical protein NEPG_00801 [Nematocida parisii ERTm1]
MAMQNMIDSTKQLGDKFISMAGEAKDTLINAYNTNKEPVLNSIKTGAESVFETSKKTTEHVIKNTPRYIETSKEYTTNNWVPMLIGAGAFLVILIVMKMVLMLRKSE